MRVLDKDLSDHYYSAMVDRERGDILSLAIREVGDQQQAEVVADEVSGFLSAMGIKPLSSRPLRRGLGTTYDTRQAILNPELYRQLHSGELVLDEDDPRSTPSTDIASGRTMRFPSVDAAIAFLNSTNNTPS